jgi:2-aminoadipate transaminase
MIDIPVNEDGLDITGLELRLNAGEKIKAVYTCPVMHNPTNVTYTEQNSRALLALANKFNFWIIEDGTYYPLLGNSLVPSNSLYRMFGGERVIYLGSFSKIIAPGLRVGFIIGDAGLVNRSVLLNKFTQSSANRFAQAVVNQILASPWLDQHITALITDLKNKRQILLKELEEKAGDIIDIFQPTISDDSGFYVWLMIRNVNTQHLLPIALKYGVSFVPGNVYYFPHDEHGINHIRLCISRIGVSDIKEAVERLVKAIHEYQRDRQN